MLISERDRLVAALREYGIRFLAGGDGIRSALAHSAPADLIAKIAANTDPRLRLALTSLFLLHPDWSSHVTPIAKKLDGLALVESQARYMAGVYLQRMWHSRLEYYLGDFQLLPDLLSVELRLPPADERFGKTGLVALAGSHQRHSRYPFNRLGSYHKSAELLFGQLRAEARRNEFATAG